MTIWTNCNIRVEHTQCLHGLVHVLGRNTTLTNARSRRFSGTTFVLRRRPIFSWSDKLSKSTIKTTGPSIQMPWLAFRLQRVVMWDFQEKLHQALVTLAHSDRNWFFEGIARTKAWAADWDFYLVYHRLCWWVGTKLFYAFVHASNS